MCFGDGAAAVGTTIGRVDRVDADDEKDVDEDVVEVLFEQSKLYPWRNNI